MILKLIFARTFETLQFPNWILDQELRDVDLFEVDQVLSLASEQLSKGGLSEYKQFSSNLLQDILAAKEEATAEDQVKLNFLQFTQSYQNARFFSYRGLFSDCHDWLIYSMTDSLKYETKTDFQTGRLNDFLKSDDPLISINAINTLLEFSEIIFYYAWHRGGLVDFAGTVLEFMSKLISHFFVSGIPPHVNEELLIDATTNAIAYGRNYKKNFEGLAKNLSEYFEKTNNRQIKKQISLQLVHAGAEYTQKTALEWCQIIFEQFQDLLKGGQLMQLLSVYYFHNFEKLEHEWERVEKAIKLYNSSILQVDPLLLKYEKARLFGVLTGLIMKCVEQKRIDLASLIITEFYCVDKSKRISLDQLYVIGNYNYGVLISSPYEVIDARGETPEGMLQVFYQTNKFLSTKITVNDYPGFVLEEPKVHGVPILQEGIEFERVLSQHYKFEKLAQFNLQELKSIIVIPGFQHPIQSLLLKAIGNTLPLSASFEVAKPKRIIKKVLLWCYGTRTSDLELELTKRMFEEAGIEVDAINVLEITKEDFVTKYRSLDYDLIWVSTHGNYNHDLPHTSKIEILPEDHIELKDLLELIPENESQRMLFLNICDGATASTLNGVYDIGFGASLCNSEQAVLSHIWMVEIDYSFIYGVVYAHYITTGSDFFEAYKKTVIAFLNGKDFIVELLWLYVDLEEDLLKHLGNLDDKINENIYFWGSSVYYQ